MPPKTRGSKISKENIGASCKTKKKVTTKVVNSPRKALADKTNSASDDNKSLLQSKINVVCNEEDHLLANERPSRMRRLPNRYVENKALQNLSTSKNASAANKEFSKSSSKSSSVFIFSPPKTPSVILDISLTAKRPKRICRLPSRFDDHSISPSKFIPVQPAYASTPKVVTNPIKKIKTTESIKKIRPKRAVASDKIVSTKGNIKKAVKKNTTETSKVSSANSSADTNNNAKKQQLPHSNTKNHYNTPSKVSVNNKLQSNRKLIDKNFFFRILDNKKKSLKRDVSNIDVYEFTYDPNEEPPPKKKKRRKPTKKREPKLKTVFFKDNYSKNMAKALTALKNTLSEKSSKPNKTDEVKILPTPTCIEHPVTYTMETTVNPQSVNNLPCNRNESHTSMKNYNSVRVEDIALDFEEEDSCVDDINYSPVHSTCRPITPGFQNAMPELERPVTNNDLLNAPPPKNDNLNPNRSAFNNDPLNLRDDLSSFFDDHPVASSSMNVSARNPEASPWRVEFKNLPIKWQVNTYVKPNMTPAFESSFIHFNDGKKKHVYTNIVPEINEENNMPQIYDDCASKLKEPSIISFIKEVVEKNSKKKKDIKTLVKAKSQIENINISSVYNDANIGQKGYITPQKNAQQKWSDQVTPPNQQTSNISKNLSDSSNKNDKENSEKIVKSSGKKKKNDKNVTYFGFDEIENNDQENISPVKKLNKRRLRALKPRSREVLQELNAQKGPTRAALPVAIKSNPIINSEATNEQFDQIKSAAEPPPFPDEDTVQITEATNITQTQNNEDTNDDQSVHLFEDIDVVHHLKTHRKSYGKAKKAVTFRKNSYSDSDVPSSDVGNQSESSEEDDLHDLTFKVPSYEPKKTMRKKKPKKPKISKKEEREVEAWAAGFNSMCEDIEEFDLVVE